MDSYLSNRPKVPAESFDSSFAADGLAYNDPLGGHESFMAGLPQTGGFQSLKSALMEAGSIVDPAEALRRQRSKETPADGPLAEPSVEVITHEGRIEKVIVTCSCCRKIELDCAY